MAEMNPPNFAVPSFAEVLAARRTLRPYLEPTPLLSYPALNALMDADVFIKREDVQPTSAFKVRGGINLVANLTPEERVMGVACASTGNHGQSIAYACRLFNVRCIVGVPEGANPVKVEAIRAMGAEVIFHGQAYDDARRHIEELAAERGMRYVHASNEPLIVAGVATMALEVLETVPDLDDYFVQFGGGSLAASACLAIETLRPAIRVVAVQSAQAPAGHDSWRAGELRTAAMSTTAEGLATATGYELPQAILRDRLDDFLLVEDAEIEAAIGVYAESCHAIAEHAGAAALAGAIKDRERLRGRKVAVVLSGANITLPRLRQAIS